MLPKRQTHLLWSCNYLLLIFFSIFLNWENEQCQTVSLILRTFSHSEKWGLTLNQHLTRLTIPFCIDGLLNWSVSDLPRLWRVVAISQVEAVVPVSQVIIPTYFNFTKNKLILLTSTGVYKSGCQINKLNNETLGL